jgi:hypothetical protein
VRKAIGRDARSNWKRCEKQSRGMRSNIERFKSQMRERIDTAERCMKTPREM